MEDVIIHQAPQLRSPVLIAAFAGWSDAGGAATGVVKYLTGQLGATKFAELDPEPYYDFSQVRPHTRLDEHGERFVEWPANEFFYWQGTEPARDLLLLSGIEPHLRWRAYSTAILDLAQQQGVSQVVILGALLDAVPHTREPRVSGAANRPHLRELLEGLGAPISRYQGPTGIAGVLLDACSRRGLPYLSLWGHCPHYLHTMINPRVTLALVEKLRQVLPLPVDLGELRASTALFEAELEKVIAQEPRLTQYIEQLEQLYSEGAAGSGGIPSPEALMRDLEEFLRRRRQEQQDG